MDTKSTNRIIGDFLEINADILLQYQKSKLPEFIKRKISFWHRKKLLKSARKIANSNIILTKDNLGELFAYTYNNFPPKGSFGCIICSKINNNEQQIEAVIKFDSYKAIITIDKDVSTFDLVVSYKNLEDNTNKNCSISCTNLNSDNPITKPLLEKINKRLLLDMSDYIVSNISLFQKGEL